MRTKEHFQKLYETSKEEGVLKAVKYDLEETLDRGYVTRFAKAMGAGIVMGVIANTLYSGVESLVTEQTFADAFQNFESAFKCGFVGGAGGSQISYSLRRK